MASVYRHLLVCVDLTPASSHVLSQAVLLARQGNSRITAIHVVDHRPLPDLDYGLGTLPGFELDLEAVLSHAHSRLEALTAEADFNGLSTDVVAGVPHAEITRLAEEREADLIVLGSSARTGLGRLLGSTAHSVLNHSPCDVLAVRVTAHSGETAA